MLSRMFGNPVVCSDGVTIAKEVELPDPYENLGAQLVKEAASKTNDAVGDGTTTSVVLADAIVRNGFRNVAAGANGMALRTGIEAAVDAVVAELRGHGDSGGRPRAGGPSRRPVGPRGSHRRATGRRAGEGRTRRRGNH